MSDRLPPILALAGIASVVLWLLFWVLPCEGNHKPSTEFSCERLQLHWNIVHQEPMGWCP